MRVDDTAPAEFLFGKLASDFLSTPAQHQMTVRYAIKNRWRFTTDLILSNFFFLLLVAQSIYILKSPNFINYLIMVVIIISNLIISAYKSKSLVNQYGPDLMIQNQNMFKFSIIQIVLVNTSFIVFSLISYFIGNQFLDFTEAVNMVIFIGFLTIIYLKIFADLSLVTIGFGTGLYTNEAGYRRLLSNFSNFSKYHGKASSQLVSLKIALWMIFFFVLKNEIRNDYSIISIIIIATISLIYLYYSQKWEKINASSVMMEIRGNVMANRPAIIPNKIVASFNQNNVEDEESKLIENPNFHRDVISQQKKKKKKKKKRRSRLTGNLGPLAVRSINRIVESIKHEENVLPSNLKRYCRKCDMEILLSNNFCSYCGDRV